MITSSLVMSWGPCPDYTRERVAKFFAGRETLTPREIAALDIPPEDIIWTLLAWLDACGHEMILHSLACDFAERALERERDAGQEPHSASWAAVEIKRAWMRGEATDAELAAARSAARSAAWDASGGAAWGAAWGAARDAAWDAARDAAWAAARYAAWDAAWDAARVAEARHQITMILEVLP